MSISNNIIPTFKDKHYSLGDDICLQYSPGYPYYNYCMDGTLYKKRYVEKTNGLYYLILINTYVDKYIYIIRNDNIQMTHDEETMFNMEIKTIEMLMKLDITKT